MSASTTSKNSGLGDPRSSERTKKRPAPSVDSETGFLVQQAGDAKAAVAQTIKLMGSEFARGTNVGAWAGEHPWAALSAAVIAGFTVSAVVVPTREEQALRRLAKLEKALNPSNGKHHADVEADVPREGNGRASDRQGPPGGFLGGLLRDVVRAGLPALSQMIASALAGRPPEPPDHPTDAPTNDTADIPPT